jgi:hypothetical protein
MAPGRFEFHCIEPEVSYGTHEKIVCRDRLAHSLDRVLGTARCPEIRFVTVVACAKT